MRDFRLKLAILFVFGFVLNVFPQSKVLWMEEGDKMFKLNDYATALMYYQKALDDTIVLQTYVLPYEIQMVNLKLKSKDSTTIKGKDTAKVTLNGLKTISKYDYLLFQLAESYRLSADYNNAVVAYKKCVDRGVFEDARYHYAMSLMQAKRYQEALNEFEKYVSSEPKNDSLMSIAQKKEASCYFAMDSSNVKRQIRVAQLDTNVFNKGTSSFAPMYYLSPTKVIFTSARKGGTIKNPKKEDAEYLCDLYWTEFKDSVWTPAVNFGSMVNSSAHEGAAYYTPDDVMLFTRWMDDKMNEAYIYKAKSSNGGFFLPQKLGPNINVQGYKTMHPCVNFNGTKLYFSSNRPGGRGGFDLWVCDIDESGNFGEAKNVGAPVNTGGDEITPFFHPVSHVLYFSSNGLPGLGGYDIFTSEYNENDGVYAFPKNVNAPINSSKDDAYLIMERTQGRGFFASDRADCPGGNCYKIYEFFNEPVKFDVNGIVFDGETNEPMAGALVTILDPHGNQEPIFVVTDDQGNYFAELKPNMEYFMKGQKNKYLADAASIATKGKTETTHFQQDFVLNKIPAGEIEIEGIEYDFNSAALRPKSMENLDKIVDLLKLNDNLQVEIEANTDSRGNDAYNMKLSQARAQSCVDYIVSKGVPAERLTAKGFGETNPLIKEAEINKLKKKSPEWEAAHQRNRRTALKVVGESQIKIINKGQ
jgi:outer membrane protein OmpA-like peptidoglycan-associated protein